MSAPPFVSDTFDPDRWRGVVGFDLHDLTYHRGIFRGHEIDGHPLGEDLPVVRIALDHPDIRNASRPGTVNELYRCLDHVRMTGNAVAVILTGNDPSTKDGGYSFCSGGDQRVHSDDGYRYEIEDANADAGLQTRREQVDPARARRLYTLEVQRLVRTIPKVVITVVPGWAADGGRSLSVVYDLSITSGEYVAFMQTDADIGSFDAGYDSALFTRQVGGKEAREIFFLASRYDADAAKR